MNTHAQNLPRKHPIPWTRLAQTGAVGTAAAVAANAVVYGAAAASGAMPDSVLAPNTGMPITLGSVVTATLAAGVVATLTYALFLRFSPHPAAHFQGFAGLVLVLSFVAPFSLPGVPVAMVAALELMHIVAALAIGGMLTGPAEAA